MRICVILESHTSKDDIYITDKYETLDSCLSLHKSLHISNKQMMQSVIGVLIMVQSAQ